MSVSRQFSAPNKSELPKSASSAQTLHLHCDSLISPTPTCSSLPPMLPVSVNGPPSNCPRQPSSLSALDHQALKPYPVTSPSTLQTHWVFPNSGLHHLLPGRCSGLLLGLCPHSSPDPFPTLHWKNFFFLTKTDAIVSLTESLQQLPIDLI